MRERESKRELGSRLVVANDAFSNFEMCEMRNDETRVEQAK